MKLSAGRRTEGMGPGWFQARLKVDGGDAARPCPCSSGLLASTLGAWAQVSFSVSITYEKAEHALLLLRGQWTISLFLKDQAGKWRKCRKKSGLDNLGRPHAAAGTSGWPRRDYKSDPEG